MTEIRTDASTSGRRRPPRWSWALLVVVLAVVVYAMRPAADGSGAASGPQSDRALPKLVDLGADRCVPCKMMAPILEELRTEYADRFEVRFIDVWKNEGVGDQYGIRVIPTQIFYAADGTELTRHEGFLSREDILKTWREHGVDVGEITPAGEVTPAGEAGDADATDL
jgi:thioredoxin 1